jgi:hypothetical protein
MFVQWIELKKSIENRNIPPLDQGNDRAVMDNCWKLWTFCICRSSFRSSVSWYSKEGNNVCLISSARRNIRKAPLSRIVTIVGGNGGSLVQAENLESASRWSIAIRWNETVQSGNVSLDEVKVLKTYSKPEKIKSVISRNKHIRRIP